MLEDSLTPLSFIAGPAILTNACAIMQNGATTRYHLAITQWREFRASLIGRDNQLARQYRDPEAALALAERRVLLQLSGLSLLNVAIALFAATSVLSLAGAFLVRVEMLPAAPLDAVMITAGSAGLLFLLASTMTFIREGVCGRTMLALHSSVSARSAEADHPYKLVEGRRMS